MSTLKLELTLDDDLDNSVVVAIHCSEPDFRMAYKINQILQLNLQREPQDLEFVYAEGKAEYPFFYFEDWTHDRQFHLVANSTELLVDKPLALSADLFGETAGPKARKVHLLPELKQADYLLKITSTKNNHSENVIVSRINEIAQVITAYVVDLQSVKSKSNLIFE
ncbi:IPExxxVDY family protein [Gilvibacter sp.]|uniref:IPExxxVDY family protein n=1 Tax=Gilvibacter sp. TaxID=2729997 RepID=UPI0025BE6C71|nr:IPExxxVDY family protein [Gilvibacter sp.]NQX78743.1 IPExxxVDY family protein [Gilvibacter sp.]